VLSESVGVYWFERVNIPPAIKQTAKTAMVHIHIIFILAMIDPLFYEIAFVKQKISHYYNLKTSHLITKKRLVLLFQWRYSVKQWWH